MGILHQSVSSSTNTTPNVLLAKTSSVIAAVCAPVYTFYLPPVKPPGAPGIPVLGRLTALDWVGFIGGTGALVSFTMVLTFAGSIWAWGDGRTIAKFVVSGALLILTLLQQYFVLFTRRDARMFPQRHILKDRTHSCRTSRLPRRLSTFQYRSITFPSISPLCMETWPLWLPSACFLTSASLHLLPRVDEYGLRGFSSKNQI